MYTGAKYVQYIYVLNMYSVRVMEFLKGKRREITFKNLKK